MKVLLAVDDDDASFQAAMKVSEWFDDRAEVIALHVGTLVPLAPGATPVTAGMGWPVVSFPLLRAERESTVHEAHTIADRAAALTDGDARAERGDPARTIIELAEEEDVDLIVVGTGDRSWLSRLLTPSVSDTVVHDAPCSVLVVRRDDDDDPIAAPAPGEHPTAARGASTLVEVLTAAGDLGYSADFTAARGEMVRCADGDHAVPATELHIDHQRRLEGTSDAADMLLVLLARCPRCDRAGTLVLGYGPNTGDVDERVLAAVDLHGVPSGPLEALVADSAQPTP